MARSGLKLTKESEKKLRLLAKAGKVDLRPTFKVIAIGYRKEVGQIFDKQQPRGVELRWQPLSERYAAWKEVNFPGQPILVRTGALRESMTKRGAEGNITLISGAAAVFGSRIPYGGFHDEGTSRMPMRNFSIPSTRREDIWKGQIERDLRRIFEENGIEVEGRLFV